MNMKSLQNHFLIAMPSLEDPNFARSVTYICEHDENGAMGIVINHPLNVDVDAVLKQLKFVDDEQQPTHTQAVLAGGPVQVDRGFVLHTPQSGWSSSLRLSEGIMVTTSRDVLSAIANNEGPMQYLIALGYAGWSAGQLEQELQDNAWLTIEADPEILFNTPIEQRWQQATKKLGIEVHQLTSQVGHA